MSMPSDVTEDVTEAMERISRPPAPSRASRLLRGVTPEQAGWAFATLVAFIGVAHLGPSMARLARKPTAAERMQQRARALRVEAEMRSRKAGKRLRRLGGGALRR